MHWVISNNLNLVMLCVIGGGIKYFVRLEPLIPSIFKILSFQFFFLNLSVNNLSRSCRVVLCSVSKQLYLISMWKIESGFKWPSHGKLDLANSCWQTQVGVCERHKNRRQTRLQTVGVK